MRNKTRSTLLEAAAVCGPAAVLGVAYVMFAPLPAQPDASGGAAVTPANLPMAAAKPLTPEQQKAAEWAQAIPHETVLGSPMDHPVPVVVAAPVEQPEPEPIAALPEPEPEPKPEPLAGLKLTAVVGNTQGGLAMINGKVYRAGDRVRAGLKISVIEAKANFVDFLLEDGTTVRLKREQE